MNEQIRRRLEKSHKARLWKLFVDRREMYRRSFRIEWKFRNIIPRERLMAAIAKLKEFRNWDNWYEAWIEKHGA